MSNLIQNANWQQTSPEGGPLYFSGTGPVTFDNFCVNGNRTCSVTIASGAASDNYDVPIDVRGCCAIRFGYILRAVQAECIMLCAAFLNANGDLVKAEKIPIQDRVSCDFKRHTARFYIPSGAETVWLSLLFEGKVTACSFCAPHACKN